MERTGLIAKEQGARDARVSLARLTRAGEQMLSDATNSFNQRAKAFVGDLTPEQRTALKTSAIVKGPFRASPA
jgi:DNA-binding MarR family transcriptional regulator